MNAKEKNVRLIFSAREHKELRLAAAMIERSMSKLSKEAILKEVQRILAKQK